MRQRRDVEGARFRLGARVAEHPVPAGRGRRETQSKDACCPNLKRAHVEVHQSRDYSGGRILRLRGGNCPATPLRMQIVVWIRAARALARFSLIGMMISDLILRPSV